MQINAVQWNKRNVKICKQLNIKCKIILLKTLENGLNKSYFITYQSSTKGSRAERADWESQAWTHWWDQDHHRRPCIEGTSRTLRKAYARQVHNILVIQQPPKNIRLDDQIISFSEEDARGTHRPHNDALVITMNIDGFTTRRVMVDNSSLVDILYLPAYQQMKFDKGKLRPMEAPLVGFTGDKVCLVGIVTLPITVGTYPKLVSKIVDFLVVNCPSAYNAIIGRPTLNRLWGVTSTYHLLIKFLTEHGIGEDKGD